MADAPLSSAPWAADESTPVHSPSPSAAVSRSPTLVDLPAHGLSAALADDTHAATKEGANEDDDDEHLAMGKKRPRPHQHHLPHPHLPPHPHQHLEQYLPTNFETTDQVAQEKEAARRAASDSGDAEKGAETALAAAPPDDDYPDGGLEAWLCVPSLLSIARVDCAAREADLALAPALLPTGSSPAHGASRSRRSGTRTRSVCS